MPLLSKCDVNAAYEAKIEKECDAKFSEQLRRYSRNLSRYFHLSFDNMP